MCAGSLKERRRRGSKGGRREQSEDEGEGEGKRERIGVRYSGREKANTN